MFALTQAASLAPVRAKPSIRRRTQTARTKAVNIRASSTDEEAADSASYRTGDGEAPSGILPRMGQFLPRAKRRRSGRERNRLISIYRRRSGQTVYEKEETGMA